MSFLSQLFAKRSSAPIARDRLQILLAHERVGGGDQSDLVAKLHEEILAVIAKHVAVDRDKVQIKLERGAGVSTLEIDIEVPQQLKKVDSTATGTNKDDAVKATPPKDAAATTVADKDAKAKVGAKEPADSKE